jgi:hypothetical protein
MGNLGWYQLLTTWAKKVGGPKQLMLLLAAGGYIIIRPVEAGGKKIFKLIKSKTKQKANKANMKSFIFTENGFGENELLFSKGDRFFVPATHDDAVLIEKENDDNNPYFVSGEWLKEVSDYDGTI